MGSHSINLAFRFLFELTALFAIACWGFRQSDAWYRFVLALILPLAVALVWGVFNVPDDPSRSGNAPIQVPGFIRLFIEIAIFCLGCWVLWDMGFTKWSYIFAGLILLHYLISYDRIIWLLSH